MKWNNPGNIRTSGIKWIGKVGDTNPSNPSRSFVIFDSIKHGYRAHIKNLQAYIGRNIDTLTLIVNTWAPRSDNNDPEAYTKTVSQLTGIHPDTPIKKTDLDTLGRVAYAMSIVEKGNEAKTPEAKQALTDAVNLLKGKNSPGSVPGSVPIILLIAGVGFILYGLTRQTG